MDGRTLTREPTGVRRDVGQGIQLVCTGVWKWVTLSTASAMAQWSCSQTNSEMLRLQFLIFSLTVFFAQYQNNESYQTGKKKPAKLPEMGDKRPMHPIPCPTWNTRTPSLPPARNATSWLQGGTGRDDTIPGKKWPKPTFNPQPRCFTHYKTVQQSKTPWNEQNKRFRCGPFSKKQTVWKQAPMKRPKWKHSV